ncbi:MAG: formylglycine-generating enzyme family protein, partial [Halobacteriovoraceae bacterium]|nr:formylglycine-generating enzyme family protein [Halobacteriovoraceae bacterium]
MGNNPSFFKERKYCRGDYITKRAVNGEMVGICPKHPVERVSWDMVQEFIKKLNDNVEKPNGDIGLSGCIGSPKDFTGCFRLPTEAEWEYAARGGTTAAYSFEDDDLDDYAWYWSNSNNQTHQVSEKLENPYGLFDMHGNVWEWVQDKYTRYLPGGIDPLVLYLDSGPGRIIRGGGWISISGQVLRSANRFYDNPNLGDRYVGFRLVKTL